MVPHRYDQDGSVPGNRLPGKPHMIKVISDLVGLVTRVDATGDAGRGTNGTD